MRGGVSIERETLLRKSLGFNPSSVQPAQRTHRRAYGRPAAALEVVALDHDPVCRLLPLDFLEPGHRPAGDLRDPEGESGRPVLLRDAVLLDVAVEVGQSEGGVLLVIPRFCQSRPFRRPKKPSRRARRQVVA